MRPIKRSHFSCAGETSKEELPARKGFVFGIILIVLLAVGLPFLLKHSPKAAPPGPMVLDSQPTALVAGTLTSSPHTIAAPAAAMSAHPVLTVVSAPALLAPDLLSTSQLVDELAKIGNSPVTPEQAERFKEDLKELIHRGAASVPTIQDFLQQNTDVTYGSVQGGDQLGYSSLRATMIDALNQIGGPQAQAVMLATMNTTTVPSELLQLAQDLDRQAPGEYNNQIVASAQQALAAAGPNGTNGEVGSAFRALQNYGTANTTADAANADPLAFYKAVQLANQPDGQGLSSLLQMEQNSTGNSQLIATEMIAQMAGQNGDALDAFTQMAQNGQIPQEDWVKLAGILGGDQYQMDPSGQNYTVGSSTMTPDQVNQRILMINHLLNLVPPGTGPYKALQQQIATLAAQL